MRAKSILAVIVSSICMGSSYQPSAKHTTNHTSAQGPPPIQMDDSRIIVKEPFLYVAIANSVIALEARTGKFAWKIDLGEIDAGPVMAGEYLFVADPGGGASCNRIQAINALTGTVRWSKVHRSCALFAGDTKVFLQIQGGNGLAAVRPETGQELWSAEPLSPEYVRQAVIRFGLVFTESRIFDERSGKVVRTWPKDFQPSILCPNQEHIYAGTDRGQLAAFDSQSGQRLWESNRWLGKVIVGLAAGGRSLYVVAYDGQPFDAKHGILAKVDSSSGMLTWSQEISSATQKLPPNPLSVFEGRPYLIVPLAQPTGTEISALDPQTGARPWSYHTEKGIWGPAIAAGGLVYFTTDTDEVVALDAATGTLAWTFPTAQPNVDQPDLD